MSFLFSSSRFDDVGGTAKIPVVLNARTLKPVQVDFAASGRTARGKGGVSTLRTGTLVFAPGETVKTIDLSLARGTLHEGERSFEVALRNPRNAALGRIAVHGVAIAEAQPAAVNLAPVVRSVPKHIGNVTFRVELTAGSAQDVTVPFTVNGTSTDASGYRLMTPNPLMIRVGELSAGITIALSDDDPRGRTST